MQLQKLGVLALSDKESQHYQRYQITITRGGVGHVSWACPGNMLARGHVCLVCPVCPVCVLSVLRVSWVRALAWACLVPCVS